MLATSPPPAHSDECEGEDITICFLISRVTGYLLVPMSPSTLCPISTVSPVQDEDRQDIEDSELEPDNLVDGHNIGM